MKMQETETIGIIAAMECEVKSIRGALQWEETVELGSLIYYTGIIGKYRVVVMQCGIGKVSAAAGTQAMIVRFEPDWIINTGCAGGIGKGLQVGDLVVATQTAEWDVDTTALGDPRGFISGMNRIFMPADEARMKQLAAVIPETERVHYGLIVSGDQFVYNHAQRDIILDAFPEALCAEMEGAAIGHVCYQNKVPFSIIRAMSDTADYHSAVSFVEFAAAAGEKSAQMLLRLMNR